jgi:hypothetical protein
LLESTSKRIYKTTTTTKNSLIFEIWEIGISYIILSSRIKNFKEYLHKDLDNAEKFYEEVVGTFFANISNMNDMQRRQKNIP